MKQFYWVGVLLTSFWGLGISSAGAQPSNPSAHLKIDEARQILLGLQHWHGPQDASLTLEINEGESDLQIHGFLKDDFPYIQLEPNQTGFDPWGELYASDGIRFIFRSISDATEQKIVSDFFLEFGSHATDPKVLLSRKGDQEGIFPTSGVRIKYVLSHQQVEFLLRLPLKQFFKKSELWSTCEIEVRLYDLDGENNQFTILKGKIPPLQPPETPAEEPSSTP